MPPEIRSTGRSFGVRVASAIGAPAARWGTPLAAWAARHEAWCLAATLTFIAAKLVNAAHRPFWYDELFTFYISRLPRLGQLFEAIPADGNPPLSYLLVRYSLRAFGENELAARLPSILGFLMALLAIYTFIRRRGGAVPGLLGIACLTTSMMADYGSEARPYALLLGFTGVAMVCWQAAGDSRRFRLVPLTGLALGIAGAIASHHYGVLHVGIPLLCGEAVRLIRRRRLDWPVYVACAAGLSALALTLPFARRTQGNMLRYVSDSASFWARPHLRSLLSYYYMANPWLVPGFLLLLCLTWAGCGPGDESGPANRGKHVFPEHEIAAALGLALLTPVIVGVSWLSTGYYIARYAIGTAMGIALLMGMAAARRGRNPSHGHSAAALCLAALVVVNAGSAAIGFVFPTVTAPVAAADPPPGSLLETIPGQEPIVLASALDYMPTWWYASPQLRQRLHYLADLSFAVRQADFLPEYSLVTNQQFIPSKPDDYRSFLSLHRAFLLYSSGTQRLEWNQTRLLSEGWALQTIYKAGKVTLYRAQAPAPR